MRIADVARCAVVLVGLVALAACGEVGGDPDAAAPNADASAEDAPLDAPVANEDGGGGEDATTTTCSTDGDCATPPDDCHEPGTCNADNECEFPEIDCSAMDGECSVGVCMDGACQPEPIAEGESCGAGTTCGDFGSCEFDPNDPCDETGTQSRTCQSFTCVTGMCVGGASFEETEPCTRDQDGVTCDDSTEACNCVFTGGVCDETGNEFCTISDFMCENAVCTEFTSSSSGGTCTRDTDGNSCPDQTCPGGFTLPGCCSNGSCDVCGGCP